MSEPITKPRVSAAAKIVLVLAAAAVLLACVPLGIASDAASFPDFQTAGFSSFRPQSRLVIPRRFSLSALS